MYNSMDEVPVSLHASIDTGDGELDMNALISNNAHILFIVLDSLRYDIALQEQTAGNTPNLNHYGQWTKCEAAGNFT